jgi:hypothetical protein
VAYVIPFALGLLANSIMRFYRFWAEKNIFGSSKIKYGRSIQDGRLIQDGR